ncbi:MAG: tRNA pseudouridine synthase B [Gammaproteobacteria bacterium]|nr:MAG: tRNA pseudouridine synthase B [Gammaproteobacteria bacterium]
MGRAKKGRAVHGIVLLDKPEGVTSNAALQQVKRLYRAAKAGHTGNLDPLATGVLPICLGEATKISAFLLDADKAYRVQCVLGVRTDTGDRDGRVLETRPPPACSAGDIRRVLKRFVGEQTQLPPMYSAVKHQGQPLYRLARRGVEVERRPRQVHIHRLDLSAWGDGRLVLEVECSKGTYVRTLVEDIAAALGTVAHVTALRRTRAGPFEDEACRSLAELEAAAAEGEAALDALLLPADAALPDWPRVAVPPYMADFLAQGQPVLVPRVEAEGLLRLYRRDAEGERFLGIGRVLDDGRIAPKRLLFETRGTP